MWKLYGKYVQVKYRGATIVFDGYGNNSSTKDLEHLRRSLKTATCPDVKIKNQMQVIFNQHSFLSNDSNKMQLISLKTPKLEEDGAVVNRAANDAGTMIISAALELARDGNLVSVFANDTDVIIMLLHLRDDKIKNV